MESADLLQIATLAEIQKGGIKRTEGHAGGTNAIHDPIHLLLQTMVALG